MRARRWEVWVQNNTRVRNKGICTVAPDDENNNAIINTQTDEWEPINARKKKWMTDSGRWKWVLVVLVRPFVKQTNRSCQNQKPKEASTRTSLSSGLICRTHLRLPNTSQPTRERFPSYHFHACEFRTTRSPLGCGVKKEAGAGESPDWTSML